VQRPGGSFREQLQEASSRVSSAINSRWSVLSDFVRQWYQHELCVPDDTEETESAIRAAEDRLGVVFPLALREWFLLTAHRTPEHLEYLPSLSTCRTFADSLTVLSDPGGNWDYWVKKDSSADDPPVFLDDSSPSNGQTVSSLLTHATVWATVLSCSVGQDCPSLGEPVTSGPLGDLADGVHGTTVRALTRLMPGVGPSGYVTDVEWGLDFLCSEYGPAAFPPLDLWLCSQRLYTDAEQETFIVLYEQEDQFPFPGEAYLATRTPEARDRASKRLTDREVAWQRQEEEHQATLKTQSTDERQKVLSGAPTTDAGLLEALESAKGELFRFEKAFLDDFRTHVALGSASDGQRLEAAKILKRLKG
jgi:hypothetical protein